MKYKKCNDVMINEISKYCVSRNDKSVNCDVFTKEMNSIIGSVTKGENPNNVITRNMIKFYVNSLTLDNFDDNINKIKKLDFTVVKNIECLFDDIIADVISCPIAYNGLIMEEEGKSMPEIYAEMVEKIIHFSVTIDDHVVKFYEKFLIKCQDFFNKFVNVDVILDNDNIQSVDNYKGLMTFFGLLYKLDVIPLKVIIICCDIIKNNIKSRKGIEKNNLYYGYEFLMSSVIKVLNSKKINVLELKKIYDEIKNEISEKICHKLAKIYN